MLRLRLLAVAPLVLFSTLSVAQASAGTSDVERTALHESSEWMNIAQHLPDPETASAAELTTAADVLRARRFPEDALDYYGYAIKRGAKLSDTLNRMGIVRLELGDYEMAYQLFQRVVREDKRNAIAWNNLGATAFLRKRYRDAISDYRRASSLDKKSAIFEANLGLAYLQLGEFDDMREAFVTALKLDPAVFGSRDMGGTSARLVASADYPKLCFEMARLYARAENLPQMRLWLAKASESGYEVADGMSRDQYLTHYTKDPEVVMLLRNAEMLRKRNVASAKTAPALAPTAREEDSSVPAAHVPANKLL